MRRGFQRLEGCRGVKWWAECAVIAGGPHNCTLCGAISGATWPAPTSISPRSLSLSLSLSLNLSHSYFLALSLSLSLSLSSSLSHPFSIVPRPCPFLSISVSPCQPLFATVSLVPFDFFPIAHPHPIFEALTNDQPPQSSLRFLSSYLRR